MAREDTDYESTTAGRPSVIWRSKGWIVAAAVLAGVAAFAVGAVVPPTYESAATVRIVAQSPLSSGQDLVLASNDLASQYSQLVESGPVLDTAARRLNMRGGTLNADVSGSTVSGQNLVRITAHSGKPALAEREARAVTDAFVAQVQHANNDQSAAYRQRVNSALAPIDKDIEQARGAVEKASEAASTATAVTQAAATADLAGKQAALTTLLTQRQTIAAQLAQTSAAQPSVQIWSPAGAGHKIAPRPLLYALVAFVAAALVTAQIAVIVRRPRAA
jgi:capsular polysaccharide biosynthesis protein